MSVHSQEDLQRIYQTRFAHNIEYRRAVWKVLIADYFSRFLRRDDCILDLGCGYGEFINQAPCARRFAMDLNPNTKERLDPEVKLLPQDCSVAWPLPDGELDVVFTSNFFEHLPDKTTLGRTLDEIQRCLKPGGRLIALGPNIRYLPGRYWDFWDHHLPLTEKSLVEALENRGFSIATCSGKFLPYTMSNRVQYPLVLLRMYLHFPWAWRVLGKQFLVTAAK